ncbi:MAG: glycosyltransferase family 39 protein [Hydrococcus sp. C42_A2020_068]|uniref:glycosyltransferase family 39 protein n=1 Tax=Pleurocapsa sp. PCC 7327 TaxID=118163 RepID=UPI00029FB28E|nr:glycosyltransferase family 39 protein [Pleurocapsa sp. PCC 7327]AFY79063.1 putative membrane protein [Pleurocapsa sp. PCC 7327]MBF2022788.1 glycosyltransferase family 39 protein [Hydrococcus sp. C42_A2020_068]
MESIQNLKSHNLLLLLLWTLIGCLLRFDRLTGKPPWTDEFATLVFSLGNDFNSVPIDRIISIDTLLQPLQPNPDATISDVVSLLLDEDNHPPLYFVLAHLWMKLFPLGGEYVNLWAARSLPAIFGVISIPATYGLARVAFNSRLVAHLSAALMAVSPYGIFIAQEARHYTLAILFVIASLGCFIGAAKHLWYRTKLPIKLVFLWIIINSLGLSVHYFFCLTLLAEALALIILFVSPSPRPHRLLLSKNLWRIGIVAAGAIAAGLAWLLVIPEDYGNGMIDWIQHEQTNPLALINPIFQLLAAWITFISLLPVESSFLAVVIFSGFIMLVFFVCLFPKIKLGLQELWKIPNTYLSTKILTNFIIIILFLFFILTYFLEIDITRGARYSFTYFPAIIVLVGAILSIFWCERDNNSSILFKLPQNPPKNGLKMFSIVFLMGLLSAITVTSNLGYQKYYRPDLLVPIIQQKSASVPVLIATTHESLVQTGEMLGIAWELKQNALRSQVSFLLAHQERKNSPEPTIALQKNLSQLSKPLDLWTVNFHANIKLNNCQTDSQSFPYINGYSYQLYHCF